MEQRFSTGEQRSNSLVPWVVNGGRRLLQKQFLLAASPTASSSPPSSTTNPPPGPAGLQPLDPKVVIILVVLLFALICAAFLNSVLRCVLRRRTAARNARGELTGRPEQDSEQGLDAKTLASLPVLTFKAGQSSKATALECSICLSEFTEDERLRLVPKCSHIFHIDCIDMWLLSHISCPVCRAAIADEDGEAPAENEDESAESGDVMLLVRDSAGNASVRRTAGVRITDGGLPGALGSAEPLDERVELTRDKSWNSLSDAARLSTSKRYISGSREGSMSRRFITGSREGSMSRRFITAGSREGSMSRHSFRVAIDSIFTAPDNFFSGRKSAAHPASTTSEPHSSLELSKSISSLNENENEKTSLAANDQLQVDHSSSPPPPPPETRR